MIREKGQYALLHLFLNHSKNILLKHFNFPVKAPRETPHICSDMLTVLKVIHTIKILEKNS